MRFMLNWLFTSIAIAIATFLVPGIQPFGFAETWVCFAFVGLFLNIVDSFVKPFLGISIASFGSAFMGSILVSITRSILDSIAED